MTVTRNKKNKTTDFTFEDLKTSIGCQLGEDTSKTSNVLQKALFNKIIEQNKELTKRMKKIKQEINNIKKQFGDEFEKNITFEILFLSIEQMINEYDVQTVMFDTYAEEIYYEICNEENVVKFLEHLKNILSDRRIILSNIISDLVKVQRLANDRLKIDISNKDSDDVDSLLEADDLG